MSYIDDLATAIGDQLDPQQRPKNHATDLYRLYALLALAKGVDVTLEDIHDAWSVWMSSVDATHQAIVPFSALDAATREEDRPYMEAVRAVAETIER